MSETIVRESKQVLTNITSSWDEETVPNVPQTVRLVDSSRLCAWAGDLCAKGVRGVTGFDLLQNRGICSD